MGKRTSAQRPTGRTGRQNPGVEKTFGGSLPRFVAAFLNSKPISREEAEAIRVLLDQAEQEE